jgi:hypothetical protein
MELLLMPNQESANCGGTQFGFRDRNWAPILFYDAESRVQIVVGHNLVSGIGTGLRYYFMMPNQESANCGGTQFGFRDRNWAPIWRVHYVICFYKISPAILTLKVALYLPEASMLKNVLTGFGTTVCFSNCCLEYNYFNLTIGCFYMNGTPSLKRVFGGIGYRVNMLMLPDSADYDA